MHIREEELGFDVTDGSEVVAWFLNRRDAQEFIDKEKVRDDLKWAIEELRGEPCRLTPHDLVILSAQAVRLIEQATQQRELCETMRELADTRLTCARVQHTVDQMRLERATIEYLLTDYVARTQRPMFTTLSEWAVRSWVARHE